MFPRFGDYVKSWGEVVGGREGCRGGRFPSSHEITVFFDTAFSSDFTVCLETFPSLIAPDGLELVHFRLLCLIFCYEINEKNTFSKAWKFFHPKAESK